MHAVPWKHAPIITTHNAIKDALNQKGAEYFAKENHKHLFHYEAQDRKARSPIQNNALKEKLRKNKHNNGKTPSS